MDQQDQKSQESPTDDARNVLATELKWFAAIFQHSFDGGQKHIGVTEFDDQGLCSIKTVPAPSWHEGKRQQAAVTDAQKLRRQIEHLFGTEP